MILNKEDLQFLEELRGNTKDKKEFVKCSVLIMLDKGCTYDLISLSHGVSLKTIHRYKVIVVEKGLTGLLEFNYSGRKSNISQEQVTIIEKELDSHLYASCEEIKVLIESKFGFKFSRSGIRDFLHRIGYVYKKSKIMPGKADSEKQKEFVEEIENIISSKTASEALFYLDGCHPTHKTRPCYGWIKKGQEYQVPTNTGRKRVNINGAINAEKPTEIYTDFTESVNAQSTIRLLEQISKKNRKKDKIYVVSDNARYYHCKLLKEWLSNHPKFIWKWLPPYSPNLNIIERLWGLMQRKILNGYYYDTFAEFKLAIIEFYKNIKEYRVDLKSLMTLKFQIVYWE